MSYPNLKRNYADVSIVVCVRDGENSIENLICDLQKQIYFGKLEFIIVDDESNDETAKIIKKFALIDYRFVYLSTKNHTTNLKYKKRALDIGIQNAKYDWLLFTDVDCRLNPHWVASMSSNYKTNDYIIGFSMTQPGINVCSIFQNIDFKMLMFSSYSSVQLGTPLACTGQNQSYKKSLFKKVGGFDKIKHNLQGDDSIFLQICKSMQKIKVDFPLDKKSFVVSKTHNKWKDFLNQRIRWAGDANIMWKYNKVFYLINLFTFITNLYIVFAIAFVSFSLIVYKKIILFIFIKFILEFYFYLLGSKKLDLKTNLFHFIIWFIIQPIYIVVVGSLSFFINSFSWKNRKIAT